MLQKSPYEVRGTSRRGVRRSQKPLQALRSGGSEGEKQPAFDPARSSHVRCLACHAGHREVVKEAQALAAAKRRSPSGTARCSVARAPARSTSGSNPCRFELARSGGTHLGLRRPPCPSRDKAEQKTSAVGAPRSRGTSHPVRAGNAEGATVLFTRTHGRQGGARSVRGGDLRAERPSDLRSGRPVHGARASSDACGSRGSSLAFLRKGGQRANVGG